MTYNCAFTLIVAHFPYCLGSTNIPRMFFSTVELPEPFRSALAAGEAASVCEVEADLPEALFGRAQARIAVGRDAEARADLMAAADSLPEACRIELAWLELRAGIAGGRIASQLRELAQ